MFFFIIITNCRKILLPNIFRNVLPCILSFLEIPNNLFNNSQDLGINQKKIITQLGMLLQQTSFNTKFRLLLIYQSMIWLTQPTKQDFCWPLLMNFIHGGNKVFITGLPLLFTTCDCGKFKIFSKKFIITFIFTVFEKGERM